MATMERMMERTKEIMRSQGFKLPYAAAIAARELHGKAKEICREFGRLSAVHKKTPAMGAGIPQETRWWDN